MKKLFLLLLTTIVGLQLSAQQKMTKENTLAQPNNAKVIIQTNGRCEQCGTRFQSFFKTMKPVRCCHYNVKTAQLTLIYDSTAVKPDILRECITALGYDADNLKANPEARAKLPACCRSDKTSRTARCAGEHHGNCIHTKTQPARRVPTK